MLNSIGNNAFIKADNWMRWAYGTLKNQIILDNNVPE